MLGPAQVEPLGSGPLNPIDLGEMGKSEFLRSVIKGTKSAVKGESLV